VRFRFFQAPLDAGDVLLRRLDAFLRFFLESVQNVHNTGEFYRVRAPKSASIVVRDDFKNPRPAELIMPLLTYFAFCQAKLTTARRSGSSSGK
jgi:hypothetical protein